jgi:hypothetical protein
LHRGFEFFRRCAGRPEGFGRLPPKLERRKGHELGGDVIIAPALRCAIGQVKEAHERRGRLNLPRGILQLRQPFEGGVEGSRQLRPIYPRQLQELGEVPGLIAEHGAEEMRRCQFVVIFAQSEGLGIP